MKHQAWGSHEEGCLIVLSSLGQLNASQRAPGLNLQIIANGSN